MSRKEALIGPVCGEVAVAVMLNDPSEEGLKVVVADPDGPIRLEDGVKCPPTEDQVTFSPFSGSPRNRPVIVKAADSFE